MEITEFQVPNLRPLPGVLVQQAGGSQPGPGALNDVRLVTGPAPVEIYLVGATREAPFEPPGIRGLPTGCTHCAPERATT